MSAAIICAGCGASPEQNAPVRAREFDGLQLATCPECAGFLHTFLRTGKARAAGIIRAYSTASKQAGGAR